MARFRKSKNLIIVLSVLLVALLAFRLYLPILLRDYVNRNLRDMQEYSGHVAAVHVALWRGAYGVKDVVIVKKNASKNEPFTTVDYLQLAIQWRALLHGSIVGRADFIRPTLNLVQGESSSETQLGTDNDWAKALEKLFPFNFNEITVQQGTVKFRAPGIKSGDAMTLRAIEARVSNLTNVLDRNNEAYARFELHGKVLGNAPLDISGRLNPYAPSPTFEMDLQLEQVRLPELNPWLEVYAKVNAEAGTFSLYSSSAAADRKFKGYVKPLLKDVQIVSIQREEAGPLQKLWAGLVQVVATIFKNHPQDQLATKIPFSGSIEDPKAGVFATIVNVLRNAFVTAFSSSIDQKIGIDDVGKQDDEKTAREKPAPAAPK